MPPLFPSRTPAGTASAPPSLCSSPVSGSGPVAAGRVTGGPVPRAQTGPPAPPRGGGRAVYILGFVHFLLILTPDMPLGWQEDGCRTGGGRLCGRVSLFWAFGADNLTGAVR